MNRVALITGGQGDLARAVAPRLEQAGFTVLTPGRSELDVTSTESVSTYFAKLERLDLLLNNAGLIRDGVLLKQEESDRDAVLETNLTGAFRCARAAIGLMVKQRAGHLIHTGSWAARAGTFGQTNYAAAKAGLIGLSHSLALEYGKRGIQSNVVLPGFLETKFTQGVPDEARERTRSLHALGRFNTVEEAAAFLVHLADMKHVSGQVFQLDSRIAPWT